MELEEPGEEFQPERDPRPHIPEPPPVRLVAIADVHLTTPAGLEKPLDAFYGALLRFQRDDEAGAGVIAYHAERHRAVFKIVEIAPPREDYRPMQLETPHFAELVQGLVDQEIPFEWQRGVAPGVEALLLRDPAGNWIMVAPVRAIQ